jgi:diguanylate cyclase (GGDEF)-like protein
MKKRIIRLTLVLILLLNAWIVSVTLSQIDDSGLTDLRNVPWKVTLNGEELGEVAGPMVYTTLKLGLQAGDELTYEFTLPAGAEMEFPTLQMQSHGSNCQDYLDGELVEDEQEAPFGRANIRQQKMHNISLPADYAGKTVVIKLTTTQAIYREPLDIAIVGDYLGLKHLFIRRYFSAFSTGILLIMMGAVMLFVSLVLTATNRSMRVNIYTALLCIDCGIIIHCKYSLPLIYIQSGRFQLAYSIALYFLVPIVTCALFTMPELKKTKGEQVTMAILSGLTAVNYMLQMMGIIIVETAINIVWGILLLLLVVIYRLNFRANRLEDNREQTLYQVTGLRILISFMIIGIMVCSWHEARHLYSGGIWDIAYNNTLLIGPLFYAYYQMLIFYESMSDSYARNREYAFLSRLAYEDGLTKLPNRSRIDAYLKRLEAVKNDYCIISLDLDGLKRVNDTFGHWAGDKLLMTYGDALKSVFGKDYFCGRIGGDEFMAVLTGVDEAKVNQILQQLQDTLGALNEKGEDLWEYSCAAGYAFRHECTEDFTHNTYLLADQRMYRQKEEHHKKQAALS